MGLILYPYVTSGPRISVHIYNDEFTQNKKLINDGTLNYFEIC
jgi:hypothetical protein